jgi:hypothetical protein
VQFSVIVAPEEKPAVVALDAITATFRFRAARRLGERDPVGAVSCRKVLVMPALRALRGNKKPFLALYWPATEGERCRVVQLLESHCRICGLCPSAKIMPPPAPLDGSESP